MIKSIILISLYIFISVRVVPAQGIVIDHTCTDVSQIPADVIDDIQENIKWHYAHTSHGTQINCGLESLEVIDSSLQMEWEHNYLPDVENSLCIFDGQENFTYITPEGYWREDGWQWTQDVLNHNPEINVSMWLWCTQMNYYDSAHVQIYLDSIASFEAMYPDVTFIYATGTAEAWGSSGYNRYLRNEMIRRYCIDNNKILFDFADIDCWYNGEQNSIVYEGETIPVEHQAYYGEDCGHTNELSTIQKAKAAWWMMARLRGWDSNSISLSLKVNLEGPFKDSDMTTNLNSYGLLPLSQPYDTLPWNYTGGEMVLEITNENIVDWLLVELRDAPDSASATSATIIDRQVAFLLNNGEIISINNSPLNFNIQISNKLFVVVRHRNHLGIMSAFPVSESGGLFIYDFTTDANKVYGGNNGCKELSPGIWGMIGGDGDSNGEINISDIITSWAPQTGKKGYLSGDFDFEGQVNNNDKDDIWLENIGVVEQVPD
ncbi:MAG: hypothetical protein B6D61_11970 [Bacteroidetes bacterium 4484_249]|nr:MAG: hypothetical protein B6D61_11970 [Bacteroidetes bacterium 4484_249]